MRRNPNWQNPSDRNAPHLLAGPFTEWPGSAQADAVLLADFAEAQVITQTAALVAENRRLRDALRDVLDSLGALANPSDLQGMGIPGARQAEILALALAPSPATGSEGGAT
jgi:hypothetical protein